MWPLSARASRERHIVTVDGYAESQVDRASTPLQRTVMRVGGLVVLSLLLAGCGVSRRPDPIPATRPATTPGKSHPATATCDSCTAPAVDQVLLIRSTERLVELKSRGGACAAYGSVLETSLSKGRVSVRPFMWRVDGRLVSGEARSDGAIVVARHIDPLNVGVRTIEDMLWTLEHEGAHVAFRISNNRDAVEDHANQLVRECRG
jgi:hypothetical protein